MNIIVENVTKRKNLLWRSIKIKKSLDEICHSLEMELMPSERLKINKHDMLKVRCENQLFKPEWADLITTVLVDEITAYVDATKHNLEVLGRSPARDIIDSTWSDRFAGVNQTLKTIVNSIGSRFNIVCDTFPPDGSDPTEIVPFFSFENESPWTKLINEADNQGYILTSNQAGNLYLWEAASGSRREPFQITEGINVKSIRWTENGSNQFHEYVVKGNGTEEQEIDYTCRGNRILCIDAREILFDKRLSRRVKTEMLRRSENKLVVSVPGWGLTDKQIKTLGNMGKPELFWFLNFLVPVKLPSLGLNDSLLVSEVEYTATAEEFYCDLTLVNKEVYL
jgi:prophage tail gpP-like protein